MEARDEIIKRDKKVSIIVPEKINFDIEQFVRLNKITGLSNNIQIFPKKGLPLMFKTAVGNLGTISVYIKSKEFVNEEKQQD